MGESVTRVGSESTCPNQSQVKPAETLVARVSVRLTLATAGVWQHSAQPASKAAHCSPPQTTVPSLARHGFLFSLLRFTPSRPPLLTDSPW